VRTVRANRNDKACQSALDEVRQAATSTQNLMHPIITAVEANATVGEIADTLRAVFGEFEETATV